MGDKAKAGPKTETRYVLMSGRHYRPLPGGKQQRFLPGDILELWPEELQAFGDKFCRLDLFDHREAEYDAGQQSQQQIQALIEESRREAAETQEAPRDAAAEKRAAKIKAMAERERKSRSLRL
jgi:hypothetical protein